MNFLAHLALAAPTDASRIGNLLGDFAKGTLEALAETYPPEVINGIITHRAIDRFTDEHPTFSEAKILLAPKRRRYAGIIIDIAYDHFLAQHWDSYHEGSLDDFAQECYAALERHPDWQAGRLKHALPYMKKENWLVGYKALSGIERTFKRVSTRGKYTAPIYHAMDDLKTNYHSLEALFHRFYPELQSYTRSHPNNQL
ncbi:Acyl carrier protein phosphodiesterase [Rubritalea squalenifaciens DSM 18772]|uniref:Acyl carrier protein phosphodiesterase n=1 Tax=Rubritalea squalenifaciens DSM 18772 TaxID=1123071 RepID=A0A1M6M7U8_9BACT|nr:ACP phosphodiesterase [Rubritalea squalenifaciens]SHJ79494.1 Acyl carrier protein phosphodiesterase [Rubritalea squalenifaciens DSM 18772]